jgi:hypothetical protein
MFTPIQVAAIAALEGPQDCVTEIRDMYQQRRDVLCEGLQSAGWDVEKPRGTMFVWARIPETVARMGSLEFTKLLLAEAKVAVSPGIGFGEYGDDHVRFALIENEASHAPGDPRHPRYVPQGRVAMNPIKVGLLGIGTVGGGTFRVLHRNQEEIARRAGRAITLAMIADKDLAKVRAIVGETAKVTCARTGAQGHRERQARRHRQQGVACHAR